MKNIIFIMLFSSFIFCPVFGQTKEEKKEEKAKKDAEDFIKIQELIDGKAYEFIADWTTSTGGARINLMSRSNLLRIKNDSLDVDLSYFGVLQSGATAMTGGGGIKFEGLMKDYTTSINEKKSYVMIKFNTSKSPDQFQFIMKVFKNGRTSLSVSSNVRSTSNYEGNTRAIKEE